MATGWRVAMSVVLGQAIVTLVIAVAFYALRGTASGKSALIGGGISMAATLVFAAFTFRAGGDDPRRMLRNVYRGEGIKLGVTVVLLALVFRHMNVVAIPFFAAYISTLFVNWLALGRSQTV